MYASCPEVRLCSLVAHRGGDRRCVRRAGLDERASFRCEQTVGSGVESAVGDGMFPGPLT